MDTSPPEPIARWYRLVADDDAAALDGLLADDAVFVSPALHTPRRGKAEVAKYLRAALAVLKRPSFRYVGEWFGERSAVLEFELTLDDGTAVNGIDLIRWNAAGRIDEFKVMVRPLKALNAVVALMARQLGVAAADPGSAPAAPAAQPRGGGHVRNGFGAVRPYLHGPADLPAFVQRTFDAAEIERNDGGPVLLRIGDSAVWIEAGELPADVPPWVGAVYVYVPDVDAAYARALAHGARSIAAPADKPYRERQAGFVDAGGNTWWVSSYRP